MIRFRNPGTQYSTQIQVIKQLYEALHSQAYFTLDDMAIVMAKEKLMTAYGYAGNDAIRLSNTEQESLNSTKMNAKMFAEVFRMLGWVAPYNNTSSYPLVFTYIGAHIALSTGDCSKLYEQCVLGINNPTEFSENMSYNEKVRFFKCALRTLIDLDGVMYKHELCLGPMSINDEYEDEYQKMLKYIRSVRGNHTRLTTEFNKLAASLRMKPTPVDNCTRLPIAFMKSCNWIETVRNTSLYNKNLTCLHITQHGRDVYNEIKDMYDMRLSDFNQYDNDVKSALVRIGTYTMLERANYNISAIKESLDIDKQFCQEILQGKELLFSPCQTIKREFVEYALGISFGEGTQSEQNISTFESTVGEREKISVIQTWDLNIPETISLENLKDVYDVEFLDKIHEYMELGKTSAQIVNCLFEDYASATQSVFYPLIATLFKIMGFNCSFSRAGDNGARWDAIISDPERSIPIEIKSPTEEQHLSIKAIRQALENKIILLSRNTFITSPEVTTLAVGYYMPNDRAEVNRLISEIKTTYGYKIGVLDLKSLLSIAVSILVDGNGMEKEKLYYLEGLANANIFD